MNSVLNENENTKNQSVFAIAAEKQLLKSEKSEHKHGLLETLICCLVLLVSFTRFLCVSFRYSRNFEGLKNRFAIVHRCGPVYKRERERQRENISVCLCVVVIVIVVRLVLLSTDMNQIDWLIWRFSHGWSLICSFISRFQI